MKLMTVADLKQALEQVPDDYEIWTEQGQSSKGVVGPLQVDGSKKRATLP